MAEETTQMAPEQQPGKPGFFSTPAGKAAMIVGALAVLAIVAGVAVAVVLKFVLPQAPDLEIRVPEQQASKPATEGVGSAEGAAGPAPEVSYEEVFRFRDIFDPLIKPAEETSEEPVPSETSTETAGAAEYSPNTLYLLSISTAGDAPTAEMVWDQQQYTLWEGDTIPDSPWRVLDIRSTSVVMLYGDQQVVLSVGQGIQK